MRNINKLMLAIFLLLGMVSVVKAEDSATGYGNPVSFRDQQVFVVAYNNNASSIARDNVVVLDTGGTSGSTLGAYINTTTTTDSVNVFGVTDEAIAAGTVGRICVRGPHKILWSALPLPATGTVISSNSVTAGTAGKVSTSSGTQRGILGKTINATATTDTGDIAGLEIYAWIQPSVVN